MVRTVGVYSSEYKTYISTMATTTYLPDELCGKWIAGATATATTEHSWRNWTKGMTYNDGSVYKGNLDRFGKRTGFGTFRAPISVEQSDNPFSNYSSLITWMEYKGEWNNDKPSGYGIVKRYRGDGTSTIIYDGVWANGEPLNDP